MHRWEWEDATSNSAEIRAGYPTSNFLPLADARLIELYESDGELLPGLRVQLTGGHTRGHQAIWFESADAPLLVLRRCLSILSSYPPTVAYGLRTISLADSHDQATDSR